MTRTITDPKWHGDVPADLAVQDYREGPDPPGFLKRERQASPAHARQVRAPVPRLRRQPRMRPAPSPYKRDKLATAERRIVKRANGAWVVEIKKTSDAIAAAQQLDDGRYIWLDLASRRRCRVTYETAITALQIPLRRWQS